MHNSGPFLVGKNEWFDQNNNINKNLGVMEKTFYLAKQQCGKYISLEENPTNCNRYLTAAAFCIVEHKASNLYGDIRDNVFICKNDIKLLKNSITKEYKNFPFEKMDSWLKSLSQATSHIY